MRHISKCVSVPDSATNTQIENTLNTYLDDGWNLVSVFTLAGNTKAILIKNVSK